jgi:hypothetical protein
MDNRLGHMVGPSGCRGAKYGDQHMSPAFWWSLENQKHLVLLASFGKQ